MRIYCSYDSPSSKRKEVWECRLDYLKNYGSTCEIQLSSLSSIFLSISKSSRGYLACMPDFGAGCYLASFDDVFWNTEKLSVTLDSMADGITIANALKHLSDRIRID
jgi:hypothetical protein